MRREQTSNTHPHLPLPLESCGTEGLPPLLRIMETSLYWPMLWSGCGRCKEDLGVVHPCLSRPGVKSGSSLNNRKQNAHVGFWHLLRCCTVYLFHYMVTCLRLCQEISIFDSQLQSLIVEQTWQTVSPHSTCGSRSKSGHLGTRRRVGTDNQGQEEPSEARL